MPIPTVVRSTDPGAPVLNGLPGSAYNVLKHALDLCGWTLEFDDPENFVCVFRNNPVTGSGCYVRIEDNGSDTNYGSRTVSIIGFNMMMSIDDGHDPYVTQDVSYFKKSHDINSDPQTWLVVGDDRTVYFSFVPHGGAYGQYQAGVFGDINDSQFPHIQSVQGRTYFPTGSGSGSAQLRRSCSIVNAYNDDNVCYGIGLVNQVSSPNNLAQFHFNVNATTGGSNNTIGGSGQASKPPYVAQAPLFPANLMTGKTYLGKMRGLLISAYDMTSNEQYEEFVYSDGVNAFTVLTIKAMGGFNNSSSGASNIGCFFLILDRDWDNAL